MTEKDTSNVSAFAQVNFGDSGQAARHLGRGAAWMIAMRWAVRLIGVVSTIILARLLTPGDFGIIAIAMIVVALIEVLAESGQKLAIVRHAEDSRDIYDAAWTLSVLQGICLAAIIVAAAPAAELFFDEPRARDVILLVALRPLLMGFSNIGLVAFQKELNFRREFQYRVLGKMVAFVVTVGLAYMLRSYWALAIGVVVGALAEVILSYVVHPFRPRLSFKRVGELMSFSLHILVQSVMSFGMQRTDELVVASVSGTASVGHYAVAGNLATAPTQELIVPMVRALHPIYARLAPQPEMLRDTYLLVVGLTLSLGLPAATGLAIVADDLVPLLLGERWVSAIGIVQWLALAGGFMLIANTSMTMLNAVGREKPVTNLSWLRLGVLVPALIAAGALGETETVALTRCAVALLSIPVFLAVGSRHVGCGWGHMFGVAWRPILAVAAMCVAIELLNDALGASHLIRVIGQVLVGGAVYAAVHWSCWFLSGGGPGPERFVNEAVGSRLRTMLASR